MRAREQDQQRRRAEEIRKGAEVSDAEERSRVVDRVALNSTGSPKPHSWQAHIHGIGELTKHKEDN